MKYVSCQCGSFIIYPFAHIWNKPEKNKAVYGPMDRRSTHWCHPGDVLHADLFWMLLTFPSVEGSTHLWVREKSVGVYDWEKGKVYQELDCFMFVRVNLDKPCFLKFKADSMWSFIVLWVIMNGKIKSLWHCRNWASLLRMSSRCPLRTNAFTTSIKILLIKFSFQEYLELSL